MARPKLTKRNLSAKSEPTADYAGPKRRLVAFAYDYIVIAMYIGVLAGISLLIEPVGELLRQRLFTTPVTSDLAGFVLLILPVILYFTLQEGSARGSTWGKRRTGVRVVSVQGEPIGYGRALLRAAVKFLPWQIAHTAIFQSFDGNPSPGVYVLFALAYGLVAVYLLYLWRHPAHRTPYDLLARTAVIVPRPERR